MRVILRSILVLIVVTSVSAVAAAPARVQRRQSSAVGATTIAVKVGGSSYDASGQASCRHAPQASIYNRPAQQWNVQHTDGQRSLTLTLWRPAPSGEDMFTLGVSLGGKSHNVTTVKVGAQGEVRGSGTVTFAPSGNGGTFTIDAADPSGQKIAGTIACDAFAPVIAEGG